MLVTSCMEFKSQCTHQQFKHTACMYMQCKTLCGVNFMGRIRIATIVNLVLTIHYYQCPDCWYKNYHDGLCRSLSGAIHNHNIIQSCESLVFSFRSMYTVYIYI